VPAGIVTFVLHPVPVETAPRRTSDASQPLCRSCSSPEKPAVTLSLTLPPPATAGVTDEGATRLATLHATGIRVAVPLSELQVIDPNVYWGTAGASGASRGMFRVWLWPGLRVKVAGVTDDMRR
jgi:hypothetical protein